MSFHTPARVGTGVIAAMLIATTLPASPRFDEAASRPDASVLLAVNSAQVSPLIITDSTDPYANRCAIDPVGDIQRLFPDPPYVQAYHSGRSSCSAWAPTSDDHLIHRQGVQRFSNGWRDYFVVSNSTDRERRPGIEIVEIGSHTWNPDYLGGNATPFSSPPCSDRIVTYLPGTSWNFDHAGGLQAAGKFVVVPFEHSDDGYTAGFQVADLADPANPAWISRVWRSRGEISNAGAAALARLSDNRFLVLIFGNDSDDVEVFMSSSDKMPARGSGSRWLSMAQAATPSGFSSYQNVQLVSSCDGRFFAVGTHKNGASDDWVDLWNVRFLPSLQPSFTKVANRRVRCSSPATDGQRFCDFDAGAGIHVNSSGTLVLYGIEHYDDGYPFDGTVVKMREFHP